VTCKITPQLCVRESCGFRLQTRNSVVPLSSPVHASQS
jgi:hypothetical protein